MSETDKQLTDIYVEKTEI